MVGSEVGGEVVKVVVVLKGEMNQTSTIDVVDVRFKLRSHAQSSCSILPHRSSIRKITILSFY